MPAIKNKVKNAKLSNIHTLRTIIHRVKHITSLSQELQFRPLGVCSLTLVPPKETKEQMFINSTLKAVYIDIFLFYERLKTSGNVTREKSLADLFITSDKYKFQAFAFLIYNCFSLRRTSPTDIQA